MEEQIRMRMPPALKHMLTKDWQESSRKSKVHAFADIVCVVCEILYKIPSPISQDLV